MSFAAARVLGVVECCEVTAHTRVLDRTSPQNCTHAAASANPACAVFPQCRQGYGITTMKHCHHRRRLLLLLPAVLELAAQGVLENTYVIYMSDNGCGREAWVRGGRD